MEKITQKTITTTETIHNFYCDECGEHFGASREFSDGYYHELGRVGLEIYTPNGWYKVNKCLCDQCKTKFMSNVYNTLESIGFSNNTDD